MRVYPAYSSWRVTSSSLASKRWTVCEVNLAPDDLREGGRKVRALTWGGPVGEHGARGTAAPILYGTSSR